MIELDPQTSALVLIDLQNRFMAAPFAPYSGREVLERGMALAARARAAGALVVLVRVEWSHEDSPPSDVDRPSPPRPGDAPPEWATSSPDWPGQGTC